VVCVRLSPVRWVRWSPVRWVRCFAVRQWDVPLSPG